MSGDVLSDLVSGVLCEHQRRWAEHDFGKLVAALGAGRCQEAELRLRALGESLRLWGSTPCAQHSTNRDWPTTLRRIEIRAAKSSWRAGTLALCGERDLDYVGGSAFGALAFVRGGDLCEAWFILEAAHRRLTGQERRPMPEPGRVRLRVLAGEADAATATPPRGRLQVVGPRGGRRPRKQTRGAT